MKREPKVEYNITSEGLFQSAQVTYHSVLNPNEELIIEFDNQVKRWYVYGEGGSTNDCVKPAINITKRRFIPIDERKKIIIEDLEKKRAEMSLIDRIKSRRKMNAEIEKRLETSPEYETLYNTKISFEGKDVNYSSNTGLMKNFTEDLCNFAKDLPQEKLNNVLQYKGHDFFKEIFHSRNVPDLDPVGKEFLPRIKYAIDLLVKKGLKLEPHKAIHKKLLLEERKKQEQEQEQKKTETLGHIKNAREVLERF